MSRWVDGATDPMFTLEVLQWHDGPLSPGLEGLNPGALDGPEDALGTLESLFRRVPPAWGRPLTAHGNLILALIALAGLMAAVVAAVALSDGPLRFTLVFCGLLLAYEAVLVGLLLRGRRV